MNGSYLWSWHSAAAHGRAEPGDRHGPHAVAGVLGEVFAGLGSPFAGHHVQAVEAGGHELLGRRVGQQVAGKLLDGELVERLVAVERVDDVIAVREDRAGPDRRGSRPCRRTGPGRARERPSARRNGASRAAGRPAARRRRGSVSCSKARTSSGVGGRPIRSSESRRIRVRRSASGDGVMPFASSVLEDERVDRVADPGRCS